MWLEPEMALIKKDIQKKQEMASYVVGARDGSNNKQCLDEARNGFICGWSQKWLK